MTQGTILNIFVVTYKGKEYEKEHIFESLLLSTSETNTTL